MRPRRRVEPDRSPSRGSGRAVGAVLLPAGAFILLTLVGPDTAHAETRFRQSSSAGAASDNGTLDRSGDITQARPAAAEHVKKRVQQTVETAASDVPAPRNALTQEVLIPAAGTGPLSATPPPREGAADETAQPVAETARSAVREHKAEVVRQAQPPVAGTACRAQVAAEEAAEAAHPVTEPARRKIVPPARRPTTPRLRSQACEVVGSDRTTPREVRGAAEPRSRRPGPEADAARPVPGPDPGVGAAEPAAPLSELLPKLLERATEAVEDIAPAPRGSQPTPPAAGSPATPARHAGLPSVPARDGPAAPLSARRGDAATRMSSPHLLRHSAPAPPPPRPVDPMSPGTCAAAQIPQGSGGGTPDDEATLVRHERRSPPVIDATVAVEPPGPRSRTLQVTARPG
jgi:hypothetical protein